MTILTRNSDYGRKRLKCFLDARVVGADNMGDVGSLQICVGCVYEYFSVRFHMDKTETGG